MTQPYSEPLFIVSAKLANQDVISRSAWGEHYAYERAYDMLNLDRESPVIKVTIRDAETGLLVHCVEPHDHVASEVDPEVDLYDLIPF